MSNDIGAVNASRTPENFEESSVIWVNRTVTGGARRQTLLDDVEELNRKTNELREERQKVEGKARKNVPVTAQG
jgi:hypothetical protein